MPARRCCPAMIERGLRRISTSPRPPGLKGYAYVSAYCAAKQRAGRPHPCARGGDRDSRRHRERVCPGYTDTELVRDSSTASRRKTGRPRAELLPSTRRCADRRLIAPEEVAARRALSLLARAAAVTGTRSHRGGEPVTEDSAIPLMPRPRSRSGRTTTRSCGCGCGSFTCKEMIEGEVRGGCAKPSRSRCRASTLMGAQLDRTPEGHDARELPNA